MTRGCREGAETVPLARRGRGQAQEEPWEHVRCINGNEVAAPNGRRGGGLYVCLCNHGRPPRASRPGPNSPRDCLVVADDQAHQGRKTGCGPAGPQDPQRKRSSLVRCACAAARGLSRPRHLPVQRPLVLEPGRREAITGTRRDLRLGPRHLRPPVRPRGPGRRERPLPRPGADPATRPPHGARVRLRKHTVGGADRDGTTRRRHAVRHRLSREPNPARRPRRPLL